MSSMMPMLFINLIIILTLLGIGIYGFVLFVKLANRAIKALDIYINEKTNKVNYDDLTIQGIRIRKAEPDHK